MKRLFNEYLAETAEGQEMADSIRANAMVLARYCTAEEIDLCDAETICIRAVSGAFAEARLERAIYLKNEARIRTNFSTCKACGGKI